MQYWATIYDYDFGNALTTVFWGDDFYDLEYTTEVNKPGGAKFSLTVLNPKATTTNFKMYNKIIIERDGVGVFIGYIENIVATVNEISVECVGMLGLFNKRLFSKVFHTGAGDTAQDAFFEILTTLNGVSDTGITVGTTDIDYDIDRVEFQRTPVLTAWRNLAELAGGEFAINTDKTIDFLTRLGTDKSASISLRYNVNQINSANLREFNVEVQGKDTFNKVTGIRKGGTTDTYSDATSISNFGMLEIAVNQAQLDSGTDLTNAMTSYIDQRKIEFYSPKVVIDERKIDITSLELGDTVKVDLNNGFMTLALNERIIKREIKVSDNAVEVVQLGLIASTGNLLPSSFLSDIMNIEKRVDLLESEL